MFDVLDFGAFTNTELTLHHVSSWQFEPDPEVGWCNLVKCQSRILVLKNGFPKKLLATFCSPRNKTILAVGRVLVYTLGFCRLLYWHISQTYLGYRHKANGEPPWKALRKKTETPALESKKSSVRLHTSVIFSVLVGTFISFILNGITLISGFSNFSSLKRDDHLNHRFLPSIYLVRSRVKYQVSNMGIYGKVLDAQMLVT